MKIKLVDFIRLIENVKSIPELKIKCDLLYGEQFDVILKKYLDCMNYELSYEVLYYITPSELGSILTLIGQHYEKQHIFFISSSKNIDNYSYIKYVDEYYLNDEYKFENISINI